MANLVYTTGLAEIMDGTIDWVNDTLVMMAVTSSYVANVDHLVVDAGGADDPVDHEIDCTGYTGATRGWGGSSRKVLANAAVTADTGNDRVELYADDVDYGVLGGASNDDIAAFIVIKEGGANDTTSRLICYIDTVSGSPSLPYTTVGVNVTLNTSAEGIIQIPTV